ncbi:hypothetical protein OF83DRAFT_1024150, partial [Amylostereum chailletii]
GRPQGSGNYKTVDSHLLLHCVEAELPLGNRGWQCVTKAFNRKAHELGRPPRTLKSLETKYKQWTRKKKPTGRGVCPPEISRAHEIEEMIGNKA